MGMMLARVTTLFRGLPKTRERKSWLNYLRIEFETQRPAEQDSQATLVVVTPLGRAR